MRTTLLSIAAGASLLCGTLAAQAMPTAPIANDGASVILVSGGCGLAFHRTPYGGCRPNGGGYYARPYGYGGRYYGGGYGYRRGNFFNRF